MKSRLENPRILSSRQLTLLRDISSLSTDLRMPACLVGGSVRDVLLEKPILDLDIVVEGDAIKLAHALIKKFGGRLTAHTKFHTAVWFVPETWDLKPGTIDLITARSETYKQAGALPSVRPSTMDDDLLRRDFTINAMAIHLDEDRFGELLDPLHGKKDLKQKRIRVLHPRSFVDDPTRIFRAVRYEKRYGFHIESGTLNLINDEALAVLSSLSGERVRHEFDLIFNEENSGKMIMRLIELGIFDAFDPALPRFNRNYLNLLNSKPPPDFDLPDDRVSLGYLLWLMDSAPQAIKPLAQHLSFNSELSRQIAAAGQVKNSLPLLKDSLPSVWVSRLDKVPPAAIYALWLVTRGPALKDFMVKWRHIKPRIGGNELKAMGVPSGPRYREILSQLRAAWLDGKIKSEKDERDFLNSLL